MVLQIGNPPPLTYTFNPDTLNSTEIDTTYMDHFLAAQVAFSQLDGPFSVMQAHTIFGGHFHTALLGLIKKPGSDALYMIHHHSKKYCYGQSTNGWINASINAMKYYLAANAADFVSVAFTFLSPSYILATPFSKPRKFINTAVFSFCHHYPFCVCHEGSG